MKGAYGAEEEQRERRSTRATHAATLAWVLAQPAVTSAILGASHPEQLSDSLGGIDLHLDEDEMQACNAIWYKLPRIQDQDIARR